MKNDENGYQKITVVFFVERLHELMLKFRESFFLQFVSICITTITYNCSNSAEFVEAMQTFFKEFSNKFAKIWTHSKKS